MIELKGNLKYKKNKPMAIIENIEKIYQLKNIIIFQT